MTTPHPTPHPRESRDLAFVDDMHEALTPLIDLLHLLSSADPHETPDRLPRTFAHLAGLADDAWHILEDWNTRRRHQDDGEQGGAA